MSAEDLPVTAETDETIEGAQPGREAAKYRTRLREAEAQREALTEQLDALRRHVIEDASGLAKPQALWLAGVDVADLFTPEGRPDTEKLAEAVAKVSEELGLSMRPRTPKPDPSQGRYDEPPPVNRWREAFGPKA